MPDLPWDPKWPGNKPRWENEYDRARPDVSGPDAEWSPIIAEFITADEAGAFKYLRALHEESHTDHGLWIWRWALWEVFCKPIFDRPDRNTWPKYAQVVYGAIDPNWPLTNIGREEGIPEEWFQGQTADARKVVAFKATVLLIAGLIEKKFVPTPKEMAQFIIQFMETNAPPALKDSMRSMIDELRKRYIYFR